jgi:16S rRNA (cytosine1402-N4)-methyltransferase
MSHIPVLLKESIEGLQIKKGGTYVDCTTNRGGHSTEIAKLLGKEGVLVCIDLDEEALHEAKANLSQLKEVPKVHFVHSNFRNIKSILNNLSIINVDGVLADLGLSSEELDDSKRGFSFRYNEPLLMTFRSSPNEDTTTAYDVVNTWSEETLADIMFGFADERYARRIAKAIVHYRSGKEIKTTFELVEIIGSAVPVLYRNKKTHFATKTFQAIRMATNDELGSIKELITALPDVLLSSGRACIITFHSTEDRIVKQELRTFKEVLKPITKKAIVPSTEEEKGNPRSRSAQLRIIEKI